MLLVFHHYSNCEEMMKMKIMFCTTLKGTKTIYHHRQRCRNKVLLGRCKKKKEWTFVEQSCNNIKKGRLDSKQYNMREIKCVSICKQLTAAAQFQRRSNAKRRKCRIINNWQEIFVYALQSKLRQCKNTINYFEMSC